MITQDAIVVLKLTANDSMTQSTSRKMGPQDAASQKGHDLDSQHFELNAAKLC